MSSGADGAPILVADIGGTNARFALVDGGGVPTAQRAFRCADFATLAEAAERYLAALGGERPRRAAMAVATPITGDWVTMTNHRWSFSVAETRARLGLDELRVVNDFTALALAVPRLRPEERRQIGGGAPAAWAPIAVIGPGTGLGVSGLVPADDGRYLPLQSEGGHVTYGASNAREFEILTVLARRYPHISAERLVSGPGLVNLYQAIAELAGVEPEPLQPPDVSARAVAGACALCREALDLFCAMLGVVAGNLVLTLGARGGLYIGGGIVPKLGDYFAASPFRAAFERRGRFTAYLAAVPSYVITAPMPALLGAAAAFDYPGQAVGVCSRRQD